MNKTMKSLYSWNRYYSKNAKAKSKNIIRIIKTDCKSKLEIVTEIFLKKRKSNKENAKGIDKRICLNKISENQKMF